MTDETTRGQQHGRIAGLMALAEQLVAGYTLMELLLDEQQPGWDAPQEGRRRSGGPDGVPQHARSGLHTACVNIGHKLTADCGVAGWQVPPLPSRGSGVVTVWQFDNEGHPSISEVDDWTSAPSKETEPVGAVFQPSEQLFTLEEARTPGRM